MLALWPTRCLDHHHPPARTDANAPLETNQSGSSLRLGTMLRMVGWLLTLLLVGLRPARGNLRMTLQRSAQQGNDSLALHPGVLLLHNPSSGFSCTGSLVRSSIVLTAGRCLSNVASAPSVPRTISENDTLRLDLYTGPGDPAAQHGALHAPFLAKVATGVKATYLWAPGFPGSNIGVVLIRWLTSLATQQAIQAHRMELLSMVVNSTLNYPPPLPGQAIPSFAPMTVFGAIDSNLATRLTRVGFPFQGTVVGYGADRGATGTVGEFNNVHRTAPVMVTNRTYVLLQQSHCNSVILGGSWEVASSTGAQMCVTGGDMGGPLLVQHNSREYIVGIAERGDDSPCSASRTWFSSVLFRAEFLHREIYSLETGLRLPCPSVSPSPTPSPSCSPTPNPSATITPTSAPTPSPSPPPLPPPPPFPWGTLIGTIAAVVFSILACIGGCIILFRSEGHRQVKPTAFRDLVVPKPEARSLGQEKREELHEQMQGKELPSGVVECETCKKISAKKERNKVMRETGLVDPDSDEENTVVREKDEEQSTASSQSTASPEPKKLPTSTIPVIQPSVASSSSVLDCVYSHSEHVVPVRISNSPLAVRQVVPFDLVKTLEAVDRCSIDYLGRKGDVSALRKHLAERDWAGAERRGQEMLRRQAKTRNLVGGELELASRSASTPTGFRRVGPKPSP
jgi:hypothetical protein